MTLEQEVFNEVQAALLNSKGPPRLAAVAGMKALVQFIMAECSVDDEEDEEIRFFIDAAVKEGRAENLW